MKFLSLIFLMILIAGSGCARFDMNRPLYRRGSGKVFQRNTGSVEKKHEQALSLIDQCCYPEAEQLLQECLVCDKSFGLARNTLGKLYFDQRKFYLAAWEFENAMKLMPSRAEPVNNLGLVYESVGQFDQAIGYYQQATEMNPENAEYLGNYVRCRIRSGDESGDLVPLLEQLVFLDSRPEWVDWAKQQTVKLTLDPVGRIDSGMTQPKQPEYLTPRAPIELLAPTNNYELVDPANGNE